jgi:hypothetical protein
VCQDRSTSPATVLADSSLLSVGAFTACTVQDHRYYRPGVMVAAVGHSLCGPSAGCAPSVSVGCVSKVVHDRGGSASVVADARGSVVAQRAAKALVLDCWVHAGCSGGALVLLVGSDSVLCTFAAVD